MISTYLIGKGLYVCIHFISIIGFRPY